MGIFPFRRSAMQNPPYTFLVISRLLDLVLAADSTVAQDDGELVFVSTNSINVRRAASFVGQDDTTHSLQKILAQTDPGVCRSALQVPRLSSKNPCQRDSPHCAAAPSVTLDVDAQ